MKKALTEQDLFEEEYNDIIFKRLKQDIRAKKQEIMSCKVELELLEQEERIMFKQRKSKQYNNNIVGLQY